MTDLITTGTSVIGTGSQFLHQDPAGVPNGNEKPEYFGGEVFLADVNGDDKAALTIGADGDDDRNGYVTTYTVSAPPPQPVDRYGELPVRVGLMRAGQPVGSRRILRTPSERPANSSYAAGP